MSIKEIQKREEKLRADLNQRINDAMLSKKLTNTDLASAIGKTSMSVFNKVHGRTSWNYEELALVQKMLGIKLVN